MVKLVEHQRMLEVLDTVNKNVVKEIEIKIMINLNGGLVVNIIIGYITYVLYIEPEDEYISDMIIEKLTSMKPEIKYSIETIKG